MLGAVIVGMAAGLLAAGFAWSQGAGTLLSLLAYSLGGATGVAMAATLPVLGPALARALRPDRPERPGDLRANRPQSAEIH